MNKSASVRSKIYQPGQLTRQAEEWRLSGKKIVFTNGCFDILHLGHIDYLIKAAELGDRLIIGLNSDDSVKRLNKGASRPLQDQHSRAMVLASLLYVDAVVIFDQDTPYELIQMLGPDILVKGGDYTKETVAGSNLVKETVIIEFTPGYSTTSIEQRILNQKA
jgi:D-glycero-beta-D-manno-heptose 1-phosphate adenylyltransferase